jgi:hypothetical protein
MFLFRTNQNIYLYFRIKIVLFPSLILVKLLKGTKVVVVVMVVIVLVVVVEVVVVVVVVAGSSNSSSSRQ